MMYCWSTYCGKFGEERSTYTMTSLQVVSYCTHVAREFYKNWDGTVKYNHPIPPPTPLPKKNPTPAKEKKVKENQNTELQVKKKGIELIQSIIAHVIFTFLQLF